MQIYNIIMTKKSSSTSIEEVFKSIQKKEKNFEKIGKIAKKNNTDISQINKSLVQINSTTSENMSQIKSLDDKVEKRTAEIIDVMKALFEDQNEKIDKLIKNNDETKKDISNHNTRLNDHDSRIERLELKAN